MYFIKYHYANNFIQSKLLIDYCHILPKSHESEQDTVSITQITSIWDFALAIGASQCVRLSAFLFLALAVSFFVGMLVCVYAFS